MALKTSNRELSKNEKILLGGLCVIGIAFLVNTLIIAPNNKKLKPLKNEISTLEKQITNLKTINLDIEKNEQELKVLKDKYNEASETIPRTDRYPQVVKDLEGMAGKAGVKIKTESFSKPAVFSNEEENQNNSEQAQNNNTLNQMSGLSSFTVNLTIEGDFNKAMKFIDELENDSRILEVKDFSSNDKSTNITIAYFIAGGDEVEEFDFNNGSYGKGNIFR
ncbi:hypothetical protein BH721_13330 [Clostridium baratii]|uniref:hypothetical protein n=1 Tax=Clostridium baratii TaxID=1561 RepID=UPI0009A345A4|nr:hypothetical protein [Clostridium baratii]OPF52090.1 hypothetical protein A1M12_14110 [Clostridium baratii]OPF56634.1 hypothetical protein BH721_13330 [Clostridium baratii]OPF57894.1 hypothetical protein BH724_06520 [Clostridium baratii]OPF58512.1 hypothetical protein BH725_11665 [Clostridium baratii]